MEGKRSRGMFCPHVDENGEICDAFMKEKSIFFHCPKCGHAEMMSDKDRHEKIRREENKTSTPRRVGLALSISSEVDTIFAGVPRRTRT